MIDQCSVADSANLPGLCQSSNLWEGCVMLFGRGAMFVDEDSKHLI